MNSNIRKHAIYNIKCNAKRHIIQLCQNYGYRGSDNDLLSDAMFCAYGMHIYNPVHFRKFWSVMCLPIVFTAFSQQIPRYENVKDITAMMEWTNSFVIEQIEQYFYY